MGEAKPQPGRVLLICAAMMTMTACASASEVARPGDLVKDEATAIRIGRDACRPADDAFIQEPWRAKLQRGVWHVWLWAPGSGHWGPTYQTNVTAADGKSDGCELRVTAD